MVGHNIPPRSPMPQIHQRSPKPQQETETHLLQVKTGPLTISVIHPPAIDVVKRDTTVRVVLYTPIETGTKCSKRTDAFDEGWSEAVDNNRKSLQHPRSVLNEGVR